MRRLLTGLALAVAAAGCYTVETVRSPILGAGGDSHVYIRNSGWNILGCIPVVCGNANLDSWCGIVMFRDDAKVEIAKEKLVKIAEERGCDVRDVTYLEDSAVVQTFSSIPIPWLVQAKLVEVSATLVKKPAVAAAATGKGAAE